MSIIDLPQGLPVKSQAWGLRSYDQAFSNGDSGASQVAVLGPIRRTCSLVSEEAIPIADEAALWTGLAHALNGRVNRLAVYDVLRPQPRGTARGSWTAAAAAAAGSDMVVIQAGAGQAGRTLVPGDWVGVNQGGLQRQLLYVRAPVQVDGAGLLSVSVAPALRWAVAAGAAIVWDRPTCLMRQVGTDAKWTSQGSATGGFSLDLIESWE